MKKVVYLVITDLHFSANRRLNRKSYHKEMLWVAKHILDIIEDYKSKDFKVYLLFLGDIFHGNYNNSQEAVRDVSILMKLVLSGDGAYSVMGNHETSFYDGNPFWSCISEIEANSLKKLGLGVKMQALGYYPLFRVVDEVSEGDAVFYFNHYHTNIKVPDKKKKSIGLFHKDIYEKDMLEKAKTLGMGHTKNSLPTGLLYNYDLCFLAHNHGMYGGYTRDNTRVYHLSSLVRSSKKEVNDNFLERCIPCIEFLDGEVQREKLNTFRLFETKDTVIPERIKVEDENYARVKLKNEVKAYIPSEDDPVAAVKGAFVSNPQISELIDPLLYGNFTSSFGSTYSYIQQELSKED